MKNRWVSALVTGVMSLLLAACGGGVNSSNTTTNDDSNTETFTTQGGATIQMTFQPNVVRFPDTAAGITATGLDTFAFNPAPPNLTVNSVFTWIERAYVVLSIQPGSNGAIVVNTRDAQFDEVFKQLTVTGDLTLDDADGSRMVVVDADNDVITPTASESAAAAVARAASTPPPSCKYTTKDPALGGETNVSCSYSRALSAGFVVTYSGGVKDIKFVGVNLNSAGSTISGTTYEFTPFFTIAAQLYGQNPNQAAEIKNDVLLFEERIPIPESFDFLSISVPFYFSYDLPLYNLGIAGSATFPYTNGAFNFAGALQTPFAEVTGGFTGFGFTSKIDDAFEGGKTGVALVLSKWPTPLSSFVGNLRWPFGDDSFLTLGVYGKLGFGGSLSYSVTPPVRTGCFKWNLSAESIGESKISLLADDLATFTSAAEIYPGSTLDGQAGCNTGTLTVAASPATIQAGASDSLIAAYTVPDGSPAPTGNVTFVDQTGTALCSNVSLTQSGIASCSATINLSTATDVITAKYSGDSNYAPSTATTTIAITTGGLSCKLNSDGTGTITGHYPITLPAGWSLLADSWPTQYLAGTYNNCQNPSYNVPPGGPEFVSGDYLNANCSLPAETGNGGVQSCFNFGSGPVNTSVTLNSIVPNSIVSNGSVLIEFCSYPSPSSPSAVSINNVVPCN